MLDGICKCDELSASGAFYRSKVPLIRPDKPTEWVEVEKNKFVSRDELHVYKNEEFRKTQKTYESMHELCSLVNGNAALQRGVPS